MFLYPAVVVLLIAIFADCAPSSSRDQGGSYRWRCREHPCFDLIKEKVQGREPEEIFSIVCSSIEEIRRCLHNNYDDLVAWETECGVEKVHFGSPEAIADSKLKAADYIESTVCQMPFKIVEIYGECLADSGKSCLREGLKNTTFRLRDFKGRIENNPSIQEMCSFFDWAQRCTFDSAVLECGPGIVTFAEETIEIFLLGPVDYENNCLAQPDLSADLRNLGIF